MTFTHAILRLPSATCGNGLTTASLGAPEAAKTRAQFNAYCFADYQDHVIDLLCRVTRVSVETMRIVGAMRHMLPESRRPA